MPYKTMCFAVKSTFLFKFRVSFRECFFGRETACKTHRKCNATLARVVCRFLMLFHYVL